MFRLLLLGALVYFSIKIFRRFLLIQAGQRQSNPFTSSFNRTNRGNQTSTSKLDHIEDADFTEIKDNSTTKSS